MRPNAKRLIAAAAFLLIAPMILSGCIVCIEGVCHNPPPRMAMLHVYALDYYSGMPIPFAQVEVYERGWWSWDYQGTWPVNHTGYAAVSCGYLYHDGCGGREDEEFRVIVYASGYYDEAYDIDLSYRHPDETLSFYLMPYYGRDAGGSSTEVAPGTRTPEEVEALTPGQSQGRVEVGGVGDEGAGDDDE
jgi:hypothetical protein